MIFFCQRFLLPILSNAGGRSSTELAKNPVTMDMSAINHGIHLVLNQLSYWSCWPHSVYLVVFYVGAMPSAVTSSDWMGTGNLKKHNGTSTKHRLEVALPKPTELTIHIYIWLQLNVITQIHGKAWTPFPQFPIFPYLRVQHALTCGGKRPEDPTWGPMLNFTKSSPLTQNWDRANLVGGWPTPLKNMKVSWDDDIPNWMDT